MLQQAKWFGFSLALHLTVAASLIAVASHNPERTPKTIMVVLDNFMPPELPHRKPAEAAVRHVSPVRPTEPEKPQLSRQAVQPAAPTVVPAPQQNLTRDVPDVPTAAVLRPKLETSTPVPISAAKTAVQYSAPAAEERTTSEKFQQRYLKEHFAYIRDLITERLVYPPMARKMSWSGRTVVAFVIDEDGTVHNIRVVETSSFPLLDKSATETVRNVAPFPKPPVRAEIVVPISFKMIP